MKIFITGALGFVGKSILNQIRTAGYNILASTLYNEKIESSYKNIQWIYGDISNLNPLKSTISSFNPDIVIHLAWSGIPDYSEVISIANLKSSIQLFEFILNETNCKKVIVSGSCFEYGKVNGACRESDPVKINSYIAWAKHALCQYLLLKCKQNSVDLIWFRIFYVYGAGQRSGSLIPTLIQTLKDGKAPNIRSPFNKNDFIYIEDVAKAFQLAVEIKVESGIYNLGSGYSTSVIDICKIVETLLTGNTVISNSLKKVEKGEAIDFWADISKTYNTFKWKPCFSIEEGVTDIMKSGKS